MTVSELQKGDMVYAQGRLTLDCPPSNHVFFRVAKVAGGSVYTLMKDRLVELDATKLAGSLIIRGDRTLRFSS
jgi:hypothetical protein